MTRINERMLDGTQFTRRKATKDTLRKITNWDIWSCDGPTYQYHYETTTSMYVHQGAAVLTFDNGETVDLKTGDFLTIEQPASATWAISESIRNSYQYHDTFNSSANRVNQVRWRKD